MHLYSASICQHVSKNMGINIILFINLTFEMYYRGNNIHFRITNECSFENVEIF